MCTGLSIRRTHTTARQTSRYVRSYILPRDTLNPNNQNRSSVPSAPDFQTISKPRKSVYDYMIYCRSPIFRNKIKTPRQEPLEKLQRVKAGPTLLSASSRTEPTWLPSPRGRCKSRTGSCSSLMPPGAALKLDQISLGFRV